MPYRRYRTSIAYFTFGWKVEGTWQLHWIAPPLYDESEVIVSENDFGIQREPIPCRFFNDRCFSKERYRQMSVDRRIKNVKLSGRMASVYALINPIRNEIFYIGSTRAGLRTRISQHYRQCHNSDVGRQLAAIFDKKMKPIIVELCKCPVEFQFQEERRWIIGAKKKYKLLNIQ